MSIDVGNSRAKISLWNDDGFMLELNPDTILSDNIDALISLYSLKGIIVCSVRKDFEEFLTPLKDKAGCRLVVFDEKEIERHRDINLYKGNVGPDRFAAFLGVGYRSGDSSSVIIDAGTALTIDVSNKGKYEGGNISLGIKARLKALHQYTSLLPEVENITTDEIFGTDTTEAIRCGVKMGIVGEVLQALRMGRLIYKTDKAFFTGGDGNWIYKEISESALINEDVRMNYDFHYDPHLVGRGLDRHFRTFYL